MAGIDMGDHIHMNSFKHAYKMAVKQIKTLRSVNLTYHVFVIVTIIVRLAGVWIAVTHQIFHRTAERTGH